MNLQEKFAIRRYHDQLIKEYGIDSSLANGWKSAAEQKARFNTLLKMGNMHNCSFLDAGCGRGDFRQALYDQFPTARYFGIDIHEVLLDEAVRRYGHLPNTAFLKGDFSEAELPKTDYIIASGSLTYHSEDDAYLYKSIEKLYHNCNIALGFNLLEHTDFPEGLLRTYSKQRVQQFCWTLTPKTILLDDYLEGEFGVILYK